jgi:3-hydroxyacyl-[acyl-carrier-protein] dehydratase
MPAEPLVDLASLDLSRVVVSKEEIYAQLKQSGRFALLDGLLHHDYEGELVVGFKDVRADEWWAKDHIPGRPIFPGALMIEAAAQTSSFDFYQRKPEAKELFCGFTGIDNARFRAPVSPPSRFVLVGRVARVRSFLFHYHVQGFVSNQLVFEVEIKGMVLPGS